MPTLQQSAAARLQQRYGNRQLSLLLRYLIETRPPDRDRTPVEEDQADGTRRDHEAAVADPPEPAEPAPDQAPDAAQARETDRQEAPTAEPEPPTPERQVEPESEADDETRTADQPAEPDPETAEDAADTEPVQEGAADAPEAPVAPDMPRAAAEAASPAVEADAAQTTEETAADAEPGTEPESDTASSTESSETRAEQPTAETATEAPSARPGPELAAWRGRVSGASTGMEQPRLSPAGDRATQVRSRGTTLRNARSGRREATTDEARAAVSEPPRPTDPAPDPPPDPVPEANRLVEAKSGLKLPPQTLPDLQPSPRGTQPRVPTARTPRGRETVSQEAEGGPGRPPGESQVPAQPAEGASEDQQAVDDLRDQAAQEPEAQAGSAEGVTLTDEPPPPPRPLPPAIGNVLKQVIARLLANTQGEAGKVVDKAREKAYPDGILATVYPDIASDKVGDIAGVLREGLGKIADEAGIAADDLAKAVEDRRQTLEGETQAGHDALTGAQGEERTAQETDTAEELGEVTAAQDAVDAQTEQTVQAANGEGSPAAIQLSRDRQIRKINAAVGQQRFGYERAKQRRHSQIDRAAAQQRRAYQTTSTNDQKAIADAAEDAKALSVKLEQARIRLWLRQREQALGTTVTTMKNKATTDADGLRDGVTTAGDSALVMVRAWADERLNVKKHWWEQLLEMFTDWGQRAGVESQHWATVRAGEARDAAVGNLGTLAGFIRTQGEDVDLEKNEAFKRLSEEQQEVIRTYYASPASSRDAIGAVAAGMRFRLSAEQRPSLISAMKREVMGKPNAEWESLDEIARAQRPGFSAETNADELYQAMFGGVTGWGTDEARIYRNLEGLTPLQGKTVRAVYRVDHGRNLDSDLASELDESDELIRAKGLLEGDPVMSTVGALREAMSGLGTDEDTIMKVLRGKTAEQRARIIEEYRRQYGVDLNRELRSELGGHDLDRANALVEGDVAKADAIAIDQAMHGGLFGWGTDEAAIEGVYNDIRGDVAREATQKNWTAEQMEQEIARRNMDVEASYNAQYGGDRPPGEESALRAAYRSELSGPQLDLANALADNDLARADAARLEVERTGLYTDDDAVNAVLENQYNRSLDAVQRDPEWRRRRAELNKRAREEGWDPYQRRNAERRLQRQMEEAAREGGRANMERLEQTYDSTYSRWGSGGLQVMIAFNMTGTDREKAQALTRQGGYLTPAQRIDFATRGIGTDEDEVDKALAGRTAAEIAEIDADLRTLRPGETLTGIINDEFSGRGHFDMSMRLQGEPENADQEMAQARERAEWELRNSPVGGHQRGVLERRLARLEDRYRVMNDPDAPEAEREAARRRFAARAGGVKSAVKVYREQVDAVTDAVATAAAVVVGVAVTVLTGGLAGAVLGALAAAMTTMSTKAALKGAAYGAEEMAVDALVGVVDAIAAAATFGVGNALLRVATAGGGRFATLSGSRAASRLARMAASSSRAKRMLAHGMAEGFEGLASSLPGAVAGNLLNDKNWEQGNPLANIALGTVMQAGMGTLASGGMGALGGIRAPGATPDVLPTGDMLAHRGSPADRLEAWRAFKAENPDASMRDFLRDYDAGVSSRLAAEETSRVLQRDLRRELLSGLPPAERGRFADATVEIMPDADFRSFTGSSTGDAVTLVENGQARIILREGAPASALREEGIHMAQIADPDLGRLAGRLDERHLADWDELPLGEQLDLYRTKVELEIDAQRRLIDSLDADIRRGGPDTAGLRTQRDDATLALDNLEKRLGEVDDLGALDRIAMSKGLIDPPPYLDQPPRLFSKGRGRGRRPRRQPPEADGGPAPGQREVDKPAQRRPAETEPQPTRPADELDADKTAPEAPTARPDEAPARAAEGAEPGTQTLEPVQGTTTPGPAATPPPTSPPAAKQPTVDEMRLQRNRLQEELESAKGKPDDEEGMPQDPRQKPSLKQLSDRKDLLEDVRQFWDEYHTDPNYPEFAKFSPKVKSMPLPLERELAALPGRIAATKAEIVRLQQRIDAINAQIDQISGFKPGAEADFKALKYDGLGDLSTPICFVAGTPVQTPGGPRPIEALRPGDPVYTHDPAVAQAVIRPVVRTMRNWTDLVVDVDLGHESLRSTRGHPFATHSQGWQPARYLEPGDRIPTLAGEAATVRACATAPAVTDTYNIEVAEHHCYYVGTTGALVHNADESRNWVKKERNLSRIYVVVDTTQTVTVNGVAKPKVIYVGKTFQGDAGDVETRFKGHLAEKPDWKLREADLKVMPVHEYLGLAYPVEGNWTRFETAVWEQHFIEVFGGKVGEHKPNHYGAVLENDVAAITPEKFEKFRDGFGHNPCR